jgi:hypothetical protein
VLLLEGTIIDWDAKANGFRFDQAAGDSRDAS